VRHENHKERLAGQGWERIDRFVWSGEADQAIGREIRVAGRVGRGSYRGARVDLAVHARSSAKVDSKLKHSIEIEWKAIDALELQPPELKLDEPIRALYLLDRIGKVCWVCQRAEVGRLICRLFCSPVGKKI